METDMKLIIEKLRAMPAEERCPGLYVELENLSTQEERNALDQNQN